MHLVSKDVEKHLAVAVSPQVAVEEGAAAVEQVPQVLGVGQVSVMDQIDAEGAVDEKRLGLLS